MSWKEDYKRKLTTAEAAAGRIESGERLFIGMLTNQPVEFANALLERADTLSDTRVYHHLSLFPWSQAHPENISQTTIFATPVDRPGVQSGVVDYLPFGSWANEHVVRDHPPVDTAVVSLSPPDATGHMSFGPCLWLNGEFCHRAKRVLAEIDPGFIRTGGENFIHVSRVESMWVRDPMQRPEETPLEGEIAAVADKVCRLVVDELIEDGDCLQIGTGDMTQKLATYLGEKRDIGIQTELISAGVMPMIESGVITGARKQVAPGKAVGCAIVAPATEIEMADNHPSVELWGFTRTDDLRILTQNHHFKAINNALHVDVTGQVCSESIGPRVYSGPGGQTVFAIAASYSPNGASVIVLPSSSVIDGVRHSRIVPTLESGSTVTVPRSFVDYIVTEYGIAKLSGKTVKERINAMIAISHPDLREGLERRTRELHLF